VNQDIWLIKYQQFTRTFIVSNKKLLPLALLALIQAVSAQQPPTAGSQIQQIPPAPVPQKAAPEIRIEPRRDQECLF
jgi:hypothetical protein